MFKYLLVTTGLVLAGSQATWASTDNEQNISTRSVLVDYSESGPKIAASQYSTELNAAQQAGLEALKTLNIQKSELKTREQIIAERKLAASKQNNSAKSNAHNNDKSDQKQSHASTYASFDIFSASSRLLEDLDYDGFFQTFSISFDADIISSYSGERALVFADLYLSRNGGPWKHYYTTDAFTIYDDSSDDEYEVLTTLDLGFRTGTYDVLIDLYEVGYSDIVATVSGGELNSLYALPLESADRDEYIPDSYESSVTLSAGSMSVYSLLALVAISLFRRKRASS